MIKLIGYIASVMLVAAALGGLIGYWAFHFVYS